MASLWHAITSRFGLDSRSQITIHIGDARFDDWDVAADYQELSLAMAFCGRLREAGLAAELTSDWPLDPFGRGDIALRVPRNQSVAAQDLLDEAPEPDITDPDFYDE